MSANVRLSPHYRAAAIRQVRGILAESRAAGVPDQRDAPAMVGKLEWAVSALLELLDQDVHETDT